MAARRFQRATAYRFESPFYLPQLLLILLPLIALWVQLPLPQQNFSQERLHQRPVSVMSFQTLMLVLVQLALLVLLLLALFLQVLEGLAWRGRLQPNQLSVGRR